jgi:hypothetical protein
VHFEAGAVTSPAVRTYDMHAWGAAKHIYKTKAGLKCMEQPLVSWIGLSLYRPPPFAFIYALALVWP